MSGSVKKYLSEAIGTFVLVFFGCGTAIFSGSVVAISLAFGLSIIVMAYSVAKVSGCHLNPAVSFALYLDGKMSLNDFIGYVISQIAGAFVASGMLVVICKSTDVYSDIKNYGANAFGSHSACDINWFGALIVEIILTLVFVLLFLAVTENEKTSEHAGLFIGLGLIFVHLIGIPLTGTSVNPARSIGPAIFSGGDYILQLWVFIIGPMIGALLATVLNRFLIRK